MSKPKKALEPKALGFVEEYLTGRTSSWEDLVVNRYTTEISQLPASSLKVALEEYQNAYSHACKILEEYGYRAG